MNKMLAMVLMVGTMLACAGCPPRGGEAPPTVPFVDVQRYMGLWYEIASNPVFFNEDLVAVTAEYTLRDDGKVKVVNRGHKGTPDGEEQSIDGVARVKDKETNSKLGVRFPSVPFSFLFEGEYWIVELAEDYSHAVVTDSRQGTLFILSRTPSVSQAKYDEILAKLAAIEVNTSRLRITGTVMP